MAEKNAFEIAKEIQARREQMDKYDQEVRVPNYQTGMVTIKPDWSLNLPRPGQTFLNPEKAGQYRGPQNDQGPWNAPVRLEKIQQHPYWSDARRIGRYYYALKSLPPGVEPPSWLDVQGIESAYQYLSETRPHEHWTQWDRIEDYDPINIVLDQMQTPPPNMMPQWEQQELQNAWLAKYGTGEGQYTPATDQELKNSEARAFMEQAFDINTGNWNELPAWKIGAQVLTPVVQYGMAGLGGFAMGFRAGGLGGGVVGAVGMMGGTYIAAQIQKKIDSGQEISDAEKSFLKNFALLDYLEQQAEKGIGSVAQIGASLWDPKRYGELNDIFGSWENFKATYNAGSIFYESMFSGQNKPVGWEEDRAKYTALELAMRNGGDFFEVAQKEFGMSQEDIIRQFTTAPGGTKDTRPRESEKTIVGAIITSNDDIITKIPAGNLAMPTMLRDAREQIKNGASPNDVYLELSTKLGYWGGMRDLTGSLLLDPLDLIGPVTNKLLSTTGKISGNTLLAEAFSHKHEDIITNTRLYSQLIRSETPAKAAQYSAFSRWVAGIDNMGNVKDMSQIKKGNPFNYLFGLTPKARANHVLSTFMDGIYNLVAPETDRKIITNMIKSIQKMTPEMAVEGAQGPTMRIMVGGEPTDVNIPGWYGSTEAQLLPSSLKDVGKIVDELNDTYDMAAGQRNIITRVAEYMGKTPEDFVAELNKMSVDDANKTYNQFMQTLQEMKTAGDANGTKLFDLLNSAEETQRLTGAGLKKMSEIFFGDKGIPFNEAILKFRMLEALEGSISKWAVDYFGVKPDNMILRLANVTKKAQSALLLGLNPAYFFNNAINNLVTMAWDGVLHIGYEFRRQEYMQDFGVIPTRYLQGAGAADYGQIGAGTIEMFGMKSKVVGKEIHKASSTTGGTINLIDALLNKGEKVQIFARLSQSFEQWSSQVAVANAISEYMNRAHKVGKGIPKMPDSTRIMLENIKPGLAKEVEKLIERNISKAKIEKTIWGEKGPATSIKDFLDTESKDMLQKIGALDEIEEKLTKAKTPDDIYQAFDQVKKKIHQEISNQVIRNMDKIVKDTAAKSEVEGPQGVLDIYDNLVQMRTDFWLRHFEYMASVAEDATGKKGIERALIWMNGKDEANRNWTLHQNIEGAKTLGILTGLGLDRTKPLYTESFSLIANNQIIWNSFFKEQERLFMKMEAESSSLEWGDPARQALWDTYNQDVNALYLDAVLKEETGQARLDQIFSDLYEKQFPGRVAEAEKWRNAVGTQRRRMIQAQMIWRTGTIPEILLKWGDLLGQDIKDKMFAISGGNAIHTFQRATRDKLNPKFYSEVYTQLIKDMSYESNRTAPGMPEIDTEIPPEAAAALDAEMPPQGQGIPVFITQKMRSDLRDLGYTTEDISKMTPSDAWELINNNTKKTETPTEAPQPEQVPPEVTPETEVPPEVTPTAGEGDLFGQKPVETEAPKRPTFNDREQEIWKIAAESGKEELNPIDSMGRPDPEARLNLIKYILKYSTAAKKKMTVGNDGKWSLHWKDVTPEDLRQAIAMEQQAIDAQPSMFDMGAAAETETPVATPEPAVTPEIPIMSDEEIAQVNFITDEPITPAPKITDEQQALINAQRNYDQAAALKAKLEENKARLQEALPKIRVGKEAAERSLLDHLKSIGQEERFQETRLAWEGFANDWARNNPGKTPADWYETFFVGRGDVEDVGLSQMRYNTPLIEKAIDQFGTTYDIQEAGYILPDGTLLDFSGRNDSTGYKKVGTRYMVENGRDYLSGVRSTDHIEIGRVLEDEPSAGLMDPYQKIAKFCQETGAVRISNGNLMEVFGRLTREQLDIINTYFDEFTAIDISDPKTGFIIESINSSSKAEFDATIRKINERFPYTSRQQEFGELYQYMQESLFHDDVLRSMQTEALADGKNWKVNLEGTKMRLDNATDDMIYELQDAGYSGELIDKIMSDLDKGDLLTQVDMGNGMNKYVFFETDSPNDGWSWLRTKANEFIQAKYAHDVNTYMNKKGLTEYSYRDMQAYFKELKDKGYVGGRKAEFLYQEGKLSGVPDKINVPEEIHNYARMLLRSNDKEILFALYDFNTKEEKLQLLVALNKQDPVRAKSIFEQAMQKPDHYLWQGEEGTPRRGATRWMQDGMAVMHLFNNADVSTVFHETVHVYTPQMSDAHAEIIRNYIQGLKASDLPQVLRDKFKVADDWKSSLKEGWNKEPLDHALESEILATAFERYQAEGKAPTPKLVEVFEKFKQWMIEIYKSISGSNIDIKLSDEVRRVFDEWTSIDKLEELKNTSTKPPLDWAEYIKLKDTMNEERLYIESGTINGKKVPPEYMEVLKRNYEKHKAIVDELDKLYMEKNGWVSTRLEAKPETTPVEAPKSIIQKGDTWDTVHSYVRTVIDELTKEELKAARTRLQKRTDAYWKKRNEDPNAYAGMAGMDRYEQDMFDRDRIEAIDKALELYDNEEFYLNSKEYRNEVGGHEFYKQQRDREQAKKNITPEVEAPKKNVVQGTEDWPAADTPEFQAQIDEELRAKIDLEPENKDFVGTDEGVAVYDEVFIFRL